MKNIPQIKNIFDNNIKALDYISNEIESKPELKEYIFNIVLSLKQYFSETEHYGLTFIKNFAEISNVILFIEKIIKSYGISEDFKSILKNINDNFVIEEGNIKDNNQNKNKLFILLIAYLSQEYGNVKNLNFIFDEHKPDIIIDVWDENWGIVCKSIVENNFEEILLNIKKGIIALNNANIKKGFLIFNFTNVIDHNLFLPILNKLDFYKNEIPIFAEYNSIDMPYSILHSFNSTTKFKLNEKIDLAEYSKLNINDKCSIGFVTYIQPLIFKTKEKECEIDFFRNFDFISLDNEKQTLIYIEENLNRSVQERFVNDDVDL